MKKVRLRKHQRALQLFVARVLDAWVQNLRRRAYAPKRPRKAS